MVVRRLRSATQSGNCGCGAHPRQQRAWGNNGWTVVRDIVKAYYDKKSGQKDQRYTTKITRPEILPASANSPTLGEWSAWAWTRCGADRAGERETKSDALKNLRNEILVL